MFLMPRKRRQQTLIWSTWPGREGAQRRSHIYRHRHLSSGRQWLQVLIPPMTIRNSRYSIATKVDSLQKECQSRFYQYMYCQESEQCPPSFSLHMGSVVPKYKIILCILLLFLQTHSHKNNHIDCYNPKYIDPHTHSFSTFQLTQNTHNHDVKMDYKSGEYCTFRLYIFISKNNF